MNITSAATKENTTQLSERSEALSSKTYVALARRYRPNQFEEVVGQQHVARTLANAIQFGRVHHAYLFTGSRGVGKTTVARILAKALNCDAGATSHPCGACTSCTEIKSGTSVDVFEIDGASHTGVDDIRELRDNVRYAPARCRYKIYIIDEVHMLSTSAFNALLKTLEEPPPQVVFIFATTEPHKIPATILSRCQRFDFKRVPTLVLVEHLADLCQRENVVVENSGLALIARAAEGSVRDALSLLDQVIAYAATLDSSISAERVAEVLGVADRRVLFDLSRALLAQEARCALEIVDQLFMNGQDLAQFAHAFLSHLRDLVVVKTCSEPEPLLDVTPIEIEELKQQTQVTNADLLPQFFHIFSRTAEEITRSFFPRLVLEMSMIEMAQVEPLLPLGNLLERLEQLEFQLRESEQRRVASPSMGHTSKKNSSPSSTVNIPGNQHSHPANPVPVRTPTTKKEASGARQSTDGQTISSRNSSSSNRSNNAEAHQSMVPPAPTPIPLQGDKLERWQQLLKLVEVKQPVATSAFITGKLLSWDKGAIVLGYPPGSFELQRAQDRDKKKLFEEECSRQSGQPVTITVREMTPEEATSPQVLKMSAMEDRALKKAERSQRLREEAQTHPLTVAFKEKLGAAIDSITVEADEND